MTTTAHRNEPQQMQPHELAVAAALDVIEEETHTDAHRLTVQSLLAAARERKDLADTDLPDAGDLSEALLQLRARHYAALTDRGIALTDEGREAVRQQEPRTLADTFQTLLRQMMQEWRVSSPA